MRGRDPRYVGADGALIERHPDRFLFGTDEVAPRDQTAYVQVYDQFAPLWKALSPKASAQVRLVNYARIFDEGRRLVSACEKANLR